MALELWQAIILGLVEGITEYLPISSTGHLILVSSLMGLDTPEQKNALDAFNIVIQGGAILAVLGLYRVRVMQMLRGVIGRDAAGRRLAINLIIAFIPAAILGKLLDAWLESHLFFAGPVLAALFLGGLYMIALDRLRQRREKRGTTAAPPDVVTPPASPVGGSLDSLTPPKALAIGLLQCIAMWPGTSRSMMTITGGMIVGLSPIAAAEFSFLLGVPTLGAATLYRLYKNLSHAQVNGTPNLFEQLGVLPAVVGLFVAAISAAIAIRWLVSFLNRHGLTPFGIYRIVLCAVLLAMVAMSMVSISPKSSAGAQTPMQGSSRRGAEHAERTPLHCYRSNPSQAARLWVCSPKLCEFGFAARRARSRVAGGRRAAAPPDISRQSPTSLKGWDVRRHLVAALQAAAYPGGAAARQPPATFYRALRAGRTSSGAAIGRNRCTSRPIPAVATLSILGCSSALFLAPRPLRLSVSASA